MSNGLTPEIRAFLTEHSLPGVQIKSGGVGKSGFYPAPKVPAGFEWPRVNGVPLGLVFHMDLGELAAVHRFDWLPETGTLLVFLDGDRFFENDGFRVIYVPDGEYWTAIENPSDLPFLPAPAEFRAVRTLRDLEELERATGFENDEAYAALENEWLGEHEVHQIGGHPMGIHQGPIPEPESEGPWQLLLQLDSDPDHESDWVDGGRLYLFVPERRAKAGDFSVLWSEIQHW